VDPSAAEEAPVKFRAKDYMDSYINPRGLRIGKRARIRQEVAQDAKLPPVPVRDVLSFLLEYAPLERWQQEVLEIVREEAYYFAPQGMTKIMNEGWASYWHSTMMTRRS
jgi:stage V sporulation protein R